MRPTAFILGISLIGSGCSSTATVTERFTFAPDAGPLVYNVVDINDVNVDTPMGAQRATDSSRSALELDIQDGRRITARFQSFDAWNDAFGYRNGDGLVGEPITGAVSSGGAITIVARPELPEDLSRMADPAALLQDLLPPLPPGDVEEWPVERSFEENTAMSLSYQFTGTARFDGDTVYDGARARIIHTEGLFDVSGVGTPPGAPGEVELAIRGPVWARYYWDAARGVMLGSVSEGNGEGTVSLASMGMSFAAHVARSKRVRLQQ